MGEDRRKIRTRTSLLNAFNELVLEGDRKDIRVSDIVERADVGRSTFYEHYSGADHLHMEALAAPFAILADAVAGRGEATTLQGLLEHFWENRQRARATLNGPQRDQVTRLLAGMLEERLSEWRWPAAVPIHLAALQLAGAQLTLIRAWVSGETHVTAELLARTICESSRLFVGDLHPIDG